MQRWVNIFQTKEERQQKYWLVLACGGTYANACRMRDWRLAKIERCYGLTETYNPHTKKYDRQFNSAQPLAPSIV